MNAAIPKLDAHAQNYHENMVKTGKTNVFTSKAYRVIYWKAGKLHIVGLALDWTFHWWWLASILNTSVP